MSKEVETEKSSMRKLLETGTNIGAVGIVIGLFVPGVIAAAVGLTAGTYIGSRLIK